MLDETSTKLEGGFVRLPHHPAAVDTTSTVTPVTSTTAMKKRTGTHLPPVLSELGTLEQERQRLVAELRTLKEEQVAAAARLREAEEAKQKQLESMGKYDRFFLSDKGKHPLGRRFAVQQTTVAIEKHMNSLFNQRTKLLSKLNHSLDANNEVKVRIDLLRRESSVFRELFAKMESELSTLKKTTAQDKLAIDQALEMRDAAQQEMCEIQHDLKLSKADVEQEFNFLASSIMSSTAAASLRAEDGPASADAPSTRRIKGGRTATEKSAGASARKLTKAQKLAAMEQEWLAITTATGLSTVEELVSYFKSAEDQKFSKVKVLAAMVGDIALMEKELKTFADSTLADIQERRHTSERNSAALLLIEESATAAELATADIHVDTTAVMHQFGELLPIVHIAFVKIGCEKMFAPPEELSGMGEAESEFSKPAIPAMFASPNVIQTVRSGLTTNNLPLFLGIMEHRAAEIMQQYAVLFPKGKADSSSAAGAPSPQVPQRRPSPSKDHFLGQGEAHFKAGTFGPAGPSGTIKMVIQSSALRAALLDIEKDEYDDYDRPLTRAELHTRAAVQAARPSSMATKSAAYAAAAVMCAASSSEARRGAAAEEPLEGVKE